MKLAKLFFVFILSLFVFFPVLGFASDCSELSRLQIWAGYLSWIGFLKIISVVIGAIGIIIFFHGFLLRFWDAIWKYIRFIADIIAYVVSIAVIISGCWVPQSYAIWPVLGGCILFGASLILTIRIRVIIIENPASVYGILFIVWSLVAIFYQMPEVGFIAIVALMWFFGFTVVVSPFCYMFGFTDDKKDCVVRGTSAALILLIFYLVQKLFFPEFPEMITLFAPGVFWIGSFVGFLGLLILSNKWYRESEDMNMSYAWVQSLTVLIYSLSIAYGMIVGVKPLAGIAGVFLLLYFLTKIIEVKTSERIFFGAKLMVIAFFIFGIVFFVSKQEAVIKQYLTIAGI